MVISHDAKWIKVSTMPRLETRHVRSGTPIPQYRLSSRSYAEELVIMGAEQSSARDSAGAQEHPPRVAKACYYEVLGVDRQASDEECVFPFVLPLCSSAECCLNR